MEELMTKSLAQIVNTNHRAANVFEKYHLDFCCKGKRTLQQACTESELEVDKIIADLQKIENGNNSNLSFEKMTLEQITEYIVLTHHSYVKKEMPAILGYLQKVAAKHGGRHPELFKIFEIFTDVNEEMTAHMNKEEVILFPRIKVVEQEIKTVVENKINTTYISSPIEVMEQEHDHAGHLLGQIRQLTNDYTAPDDACTTYKLSFAALKAFEIDLHQHVHLENNILFPKALRLFRPANSSSLN